MCILLCAQRRCVLILILLEYGLRHCKQVTFNHAWVSLNPYSIGIWSATYVKITQNRMGIKVLILILLEYGLRQLFRNSAGKHSTCLNPYSIGIWSATGAQRSMS